MKCDAMVPDRATGECFPLPVWSELLQAHREQARLWTVPTIERRSHHVVHPVEDFLFTYYPFKLGKLEQWHPGYGVGLEGAECDRPEWMGQHYEWRALNEVLDPGEYEFIGFGPEQALLRISAA